MRNFRRMTKGKRDCADTTTRRMVSGMSPSPLCFLRVKVIAFSVTDLDRANYFYQETLGLSPAFEGQDPVGWLLGDTILMLNPGWYAPPTLQPNPRITIATENARETEARLRTRGVTIS